MLLTEQGQPFAVLKLIRSGDKTKAAIERLEAAGFLRPAVKRAGLPVKHQTRSRTPSVYDDSTRARQSSEADALGIF